MRNRVKAFAKVRDCSTENALNALKRAGRQRNFGAATKHMQELRKLSKGLNPTICLAYIKACVRCSQNKVAQAYQDYLLNNHPTVSKAQDSALAHIFFRDAIENLNMEEAYNILTRIPCVDWSESFIRDWLRGALRTGWVFETFAILQMLRRNQWTSQTIELIVELLFTISSPENGKVVMSAQKSWIAMSDRPVSIAEHLAMARAKMFLLMTKNLRKKVSLSDINYLDVELSEVKNQMSAKRPNSDSLAGIARDTSHPDESTSKFQRLQIDYLESNLARLARNKPKRSEEADFIYCATDHVLKSLNYAMWSNRAHPDIWPLVYDDCLFNPEKWVESSRKLAWKTVEELCQSCIKPVSTIAETLCQTIERRIIGRIAQIATADTLLIAELGAGDGIKALRTRAKASVVINDIRWNRCASIAWRLRLSNQEEAAVNGHQQVVLGGDGNRVCQLYLLNSCDEIQINFPEPPANRDASTNWISKNLFDVVWQSLKPTGKFVLVSDQRSMMEYIDAYIVKDLLTKGSWRNLNASGNIWNFTPVEEQSTLDDLNSSFFGQLWSRGDKKTFKFELSRPAAA